MSSVLSPGPRPSVLLTLPPARCTHGFQIPELHFLHLDSNFSEDELLVRRTARDFVEDNIVPIIEDCFREGRFPRELVPLMGELGFFGANLEGYGCAGMSNVEYACDARTRARRQRPAQLRQRPVGARDVSIYTFGSEEQKNTWLPALATGEKLGCFD